jgi:hypothetical protein
MQTEKSKKVAEGHNAKQKQPVLKESYLEKQSSGAASAGGDFLILLQKP